MEMQQTHCLPTASHYYGNAIKYLASHYYGNAIKYLICHNIFKQQTCMVKVLKKLFQVSVKKANTTATEALHEEYPIILSYISPV
jgi:hypothetical protein